MEIKTEDSFHDIRDILGLAVADDTVLCTMANENYQTLNLSRN